MATYLIALQVLSTIMGLAAMWLMGDETLWGPTVSFLSGFVFLAMYLSLHAYFILPLTILCMAIDVRNFVKWWREGIRWRRWHGEPFDADLGDILTKIEPTDTPFMRSIGDEYADD